MRLGVVTKLWLVITALVMAVLLVLGFVVAREMEGLYYFHLRTHMVMQAQGIVERYNPNPLMPGAQPWEELEPILGAQVTVLPVNSLLAVARGLTGRSLLPQSQAERLVLGSLVTFRDPGVAAPERIHLHGGQTGIPPQEYFVVGVPLLGSESQVIGALLLSAPMEPVSDTLTRFRWVLAATGAIALVVVTLLALFLSRRLSRPLLAMADMAHEMAAGDFRRRVWVVGRDEVGRLGDSINRMAGALDSTIGELADNNARLSGILSSMSDGVIFAEAAGPVTLLNPPALALAASVGYSGQEAPCSASFSLLEQMGIGEAVRTVLAENQPRVARVPLGDAVWAVHLSPVPDAGGAARAVVAVWQDVTQDERLEQMRREFVANVSHEMKTPISLVKGFVEALQDGLDAPGERDEILGIIHGEMGRLEGLVADLLELAKLDSGQIRLQKQPVAVGPLLEQMAKRLAPLTDKTGVKCLVSAAPDLPRVIADGDRMEQVLLNLMENAMRYSPPGTAVEVAAFADEGQVTITVRDHGPGIPAAERHLVFERFYRGDRARSRKKGGTGLGLAIARGIVRAHGGQIWVDEAPGGGSLFGFTLPLA